MISFIEFLEKIKEEVSGIANVISGGKIAGAPPDSPPVFVKKKNKKNDAVRN